MHAQYAVTRIRPRATTAHCVPRGELGTPSHTAAPRCYGPQHCQCHMRPQPRTAREAGRMPPTQTRTRTGQRRAGAARPAARQRGTRRQHLARGEEPRGWPPVVRRRQTDPTWGGGRKSAMTSRRSNPSRSRTARQTRSRPTGTSAWNRIVATSPGSNSSSTSASSCRSSRSSAPAQRLRAAGRMGREGAAPRRAR